MVRQKRRKGFQGATPQEKHSQQEVEKSLFHERDEKKVRPVQGVREINERK